MGQPECDGRLLLNYTLHDPFDFTDEKGIKLFKLLMIMLRKQEREIGIYGK